MKYFKRDIQREKQKNKKGEKIKAKEEEKYHMNQKKPCRTKTVDTFFTKRDEKQTLIRTTNTFYLPQYHVLLGSKCYVG